MKTFEKEQKMENKSHTLDAKNSDTNVRPSNISLSKILTLQRSIGNQAVRKLFKSGAIHAKLKMGQPYDIYEQEAEIQKKHVNNIPLAKRHGLNQIPEITSNIETSIEGQRGGGQPLDTAMRAYFEPRFGYNFSEVRIHTGSKAARSAQAINARAYHIGSDVVFGTGEYGHGDNQSRRLLAHELTHVIQQNGQLPEGQAAEHSIAAKQYEHDEIGSGKQSVQQGISEAPVHVQLYPAVRDSIRQEPTLSESRGMVLQPQIPERMDIETLSHMSDHDRYQWYLSKLGRYQNQIDESAVNNNVPPQLIATVILNELADINLIDVTQQALGMGGSIGIAQIQVDTALRDRLVHRTGDSEALDRQAQDRWEDEILTSMDTHGRVRPRSRESIRTDAERQMVENRLTIPQYAIEAVAREINILLNNMVIRRGNPWQRHFGFNLTDISQLASPNDIYNYINGHNQLSKEYHLAEMITAAYNSPEIINAVRQESIQEGSSGFIYSNARIHGNNSIQIAGDLYVMNLFHSFSNLRRIINVQPKLFTNIIGDKYEEEADRVADQVISMPEPAIQPISGVSKKVERV
ncbi:DUF4157 domain-containing protein [Candidatus Desantisbacteria bacterium]|nr:DUF4157 domain-containing protein [Candidatus Desantisbacteria bacterium]